MSTQHRVGRIRPRPVSFGNPALGTYGGCVYTWEEDGGFWELPAGAIAAERLVAMVNVPPEQVPEGILNFCRSHRRYIDRVRIVISSKDETFMETTATATTSIKKTPNGAPLEIPSRCLSRSKSLTQQLEELKIDNRRNVPPSPSASAMESAASILAADEELRAASRTKQNESEERADNQDDYEEEEAQLPSRTYLVLLELSTEKAAATFVQDLNGKPFNSLEQDVTCSVQHVAALQGHDGVSLMGPFFAPAASPTYNMKSSPATASNKETITAAPVMTPGMLQHNNNESGNARARTPTHEQHDKNKALTSPMASHAAGEVQNCAVCLERLDVDHTNDNNSKTSSILTTVCNHSFHLECLLQWQDSPCPVCRYDHSGLNEALSTCHVCGTTEQNYVCLICGVVSCGVGSACPPAAASTNTSDAHGDDPQQQQLEGVSRMSHGHARQHYNETLHAYALDTETQHVWDFVGQGYVHRLLQNAKDDKLVEVTDPHNTSSYERSLSPGLSDAQEQQVVHRKLEGFASQYYTLLKSQLEQQRIYYQGRLEEIRREYGRGQARGGRKKATHSASAELISALKQERNQLMQRCMTLRTRHEKVTDDVAFLKNMSESLESNKVQMKRQIMEAQRERTETRAMIQDCLPALEEKVTNLMLQLETSCTQEEEDTNGGATTNRKSFFGGDRKPAARK